MRSSTEIRGFHAHVYFDDATKQIAEKLRAAVASAASFSVQLGDWYETAVGPHTKAMYEVGFAPDQFGPFVSWLMLNRDGLSILVHPQTDDVLADHSSNPLWLGEQVPIDLDMIRAYLASKH